MATDPPGSDNVQIAHDSRGSGPLLVLLHGITEDRRSWDPLTNELSHDHRVLRVDLRGHGESPAAASYGLADYAADVHAVVGEDGGLPLVIGHSLGGTVATAYAAAYPARGVINVDQSLDLAALQGQVLAAAPALRGDQFDDVVTALFESMRGSLGDDEWARLTEIRTPRRDVVLGTWSLLLDTEPDVLAATVAAVASQVDVPYLTVFGADPGPGYADWLAGLIPTSQVQVWDGTGHYPHLADPQRFLSLVTEFEDAL